MTTDAPAFAATGAIRWLALCTGLYLLNHIVGWRYAASWPLFVTRALAWAVVAYLCLCNLIDLIGNNPGVFPQMIGLAREAKPGDVTGVAVQARAWAVALGMAAVCIGFGFESTGEGDRWKPSD